jgi:hypothetical protein
VTPVVGERYTVTPHKTPHGTPSGRWHCEVKSPARVTEGAWIVWQIEPDNGRWRRRMSTCVFASALVPLEVQVDLFGDPAGQLVPPGCATANATENEVSR